MSKLFVDRSIEINASAQRVWDVLTLPQYTVEWASEFSGGGPKVHIESEWNIGSAVLWKDDKGLVIAKGIVTALEAHALLRFTVFDMEAARPSVSPEGGIAYKLTERGGKTRFWVSQGDFSGTTDGARYRDLSAEVWERALAKVKWLAEGPGFDP
jgi:uncharacterized protein YndB with AHSA1/START domain